jgi:hypothetical protein
MPSALRTAISPLASETGVQHAPQDHTRVSRAEPRAGQSSVRTPAFDTSEHEIYTEEEPNALTSEETAAFLACMKEEFPAQYAMTFLGFATGLRPSSMRPLRRAGATPDVLWDQGVILVRRSHTLHDEFL